MQILPKHLSMYTSGGPQFNNNISTSIYGYEIRTPLYSYPRMHYQLDTSLMSDANIQELEAFFMVHKGNLEPFLFFDYKDHHVSQKYIITSDSFKLFKRYSFEGLHFDRPILYPITKSITSNPKIDFIVDNGILYLLSKDKIHEVELRFDFLVRVRFEDAFLNLSNKYGDNNTIKLLEVISNAS